MMENHPALRAPLLDKEGSWKVGRKEVGGQRAEVSRTSKCEQFLGIME